MSHDEIRLLHGIDVRGNEQSRRFEDAAQDLHLTLEISIAAVRTSVHHLNGLPAVLDPLQEIHPRGGKRFARALYPLDAIQPVDLQ
jgi:hypothetical protein